MLTVPQPHRGFSLRTDFGACGCAPELPSWADRIRAVGGLVRAHAPLKQQLVRCLLVSAEISVVSWVTLHHGQYCKLSDRFCVVGPRSWAGFPSWRVPFAYLLLFAPLHLFPPLRLFIASFRCLYMCASVNGF